MKYTRYTKDDIIAIHQAVVEGGSLSVEQIEKLSSILTDAITGAKKKEEQAANLSARKALKEKQTRQALAIWAEVQRLCPGARLELNLFRAWQVHGVPGDDGFAYADKLYRCRKALYGARGGDTLLSMPADYGNDILEKEGLL